MDKSSSVTTNSIVLKRINYAETDRIVTMLSQDLGKITAVVKGARKQSSKLASGVELLSFNTVTLSPPKKGDLWLVLSARNDKVLDNIIKDYERSTLVFEIFKVLNKIVEDGQGQELYMILRDYLLGMDDNQSYLINQMWIYAQLLKSYGHVPDLYHDQNNKPLNKDSLYKFSVQDAQLITSDSDDAVMNEEAIKLWRLLFSSDTKTLALISNTTAAAQKTYDLMKRLFYEFVG